MRYALITTVAAAALSLGVASSFAQGTGSGGTSGSGGATSSGTSGSSGSGSAGSSLGTGTGNGGTGNSVQGSSKPTGGTAQDSGRGNTGGTAQDNTGRGNTGGTAQDNTGRGNAGTAQDSGRGNNRGTAEGSSNTRSNTTGSTSITNLSSEQRTQVTRAFSSVNVAAVTNVNFEVRSGVVLPATVNLHPCPNEVIHVLSGIRECRFIIVRNEIVIVEPSTRKIVTVIERRG